MDLRAAAASARPWLRDLVQLLAARSRLTEPGARGRDRLLVVTLHRVLPAEQRRHYPLPGLCVTPEELDFLLSAATHRYACGPLSEIHGRFAAGEDFPRAPLALTFDDGQLDNFHHARPLLDRYQVRATFFVAAAHAASREPLWHDRLGFGLQTLAADPRLRGELAARLRLPDPPTEPPAFVAAAVRAAKRLAPEDREALTCDVAERSGAPVPGWAGMMGWPELRSLAADGHEIGSHSLHHPLLPQCSDQAVEREVVESRRILEQELRVAVQSFCYPNGDFDVRSLAAVRRAGYGCAVTTAFGLNRRGADPHLLRRCDIEAERVRDRNGRLSPARLAWRLSGLPATLRI